MERKSSGVPTAHSFQALVAWRLKFVVWGIDWRVVGVGLVASFSTAFLCLTPLKSHFGSLGSESLTLVANHLAAKSNPYLSTTPTRLPSCARVAGRHGKPDGICDLLGECFCQRTNHWTRYTPLRRG